MDLCPLDEFEEIVRPCIPLDWKEMCGIGSAHESHETNCAQKSEETCSSKACRCFTSVNKVKK